MHNGAEFIADPLRDWCKEQNLKAGYYKLISPSQNGSIGSINSQLRNELMTYIAFD